MFELARKIKSFDGTKINYFIKRKKSSKPFLVFIHGAGGDLTAWEKERRFFHKQGFSTLAIDLRGHGLSGRPNNLIDYDLDKFSQDVDVVINHEKIHNFILVAHCFGGMVAVNYQKLFPNKAKGFVLIDTTSKAPQKLKLAFMIGSPLLSIFNYLAKNHPIDSQEYTHVNFNHFVGTGDWNIFRIYSDIIHTSFHSWFMTYQNIAEFDGRKALEMIKVPVLIIEGEEDSIFDLENAKKIKRLVKDSILDIIPEANHIIVLNNPKELNEKIFAFLQKIF